MGDTFSVLTIGGIGRDIENSAQLEGLRLHGPLGLRAPCLDLDVVATVPLVVSVVPHPDIAGTDRIFRCGRKALLGGGIILTINRSRVVEMRVLAENDLQILESSPIRPVVPEVDSADGIHIPKVDLSVGRIVFILNLVAADLGVLTDALVAVRHQGGGTIGIHTAVLVDRGLATVGYIIEHRLTGRLSSIDLHFDPMGAVVLAVAVVENTEILSLYHWRRRDVKASTVVLGRHLQIRPGSEAEEVVAVRIVDYLAVLLGKLRLI